MGQPIEAQHSLKVPVITRPEYLVRFERANGRTLGHCDIRVRWSAGVKRRLLEDFETLKSLHTEPIHAIHNPKDAKHRKFLDMLGLKKIDAFTDRLTGELRELFST